MFGRTVVALLIAGAFASGLCFAACSSSPGDKTDPDASVDTDAAPGPSDAGKKDVDRPDGAVIEKDGGDLPKPDGGVVGNCSPVNGPACDIVAQNCPAGAGGAQQQCVVVGGADGGATTGCRAVSARQSIPLGFPCCHGANNEDPCLRGLTCVGGEKCNDAGGVPVGKCGAHCCAGDDSVCGSDQNGIAGRCNLTLVASGNVKLYDVCTYDVACTPLGIRPCGLGSLCVLRDQAGTAKCSPIFAPDGGRGVGVGADCSKASNACDDGLVCIGSGGDAGGATCEYFCRIPGTVAPFDGGAATNPPGQGGCPANKPSCNGIKDAPNWLGVCVP